MKIKITIEHELDRQRDHELMVQADRDFNEYMDLIERSYMPKILNNNANPPSISIEGDPK